MALRGATGPEIVRIENVTKEFIVRKDNSIKERIVQFGRGRRHRQKFTAVNEIDLSIEAGTTVGLLGPNGSGKSTLLKLIGGIVSPTTGTIATRGRMAALLELGAGFHPDLSGRENVYLNASILGMTRSEIDTSFNDILEFSGIGDFIDTQVKFYSSGMFVRLAFAVAVHTDPDILLVDEVLAVGDEAFQRKCMERISRFRAEGRTIILVSHSSAQVLELCDRAVVLQDGSLVFDGGANDAVSALRDVLEGRRVGEPISETAGKPIEVTSVELLDDQGESVSQIEVGAPLVVRINVRAKVDLATWTAGFSLDTPMGQMVLATHADRLGVTLSPIATGDGFMDFRIAKTNLGAGQYYLNANAGETPQSESHVLWQGAMLTVVGDERSLGTVAADITAS